MLLGARLEDQERLHQLVLEEKAAKESSLVPAGSHFVGMRLRANLHEADWAEEHMGGISYLRFLHELADTKNGGGADPLAPPRPRGAEERQSSPP